LIEQQIFCNYDVIYYTNIPFSWERDTQQLQLRETRRKRGGCIELRRMKLARAVPASDAWTQAICAICMRQASSIRSESLQATGWKSWREIGTDNSASPLTCSGASAFGGKMETRMMWKWWIITSGKATGRKQQNTTHG